MARAKGLDFMAEVEAQTQRPGTKCAVGELLKRLDAEASAGLATALASDAPGSAIARVLKARGHYLAESSIGRHRRGGCRCG